MEKLIAYKTVDSEHDHWAERAFLFRTYADVLEFFKEDNDELINLFTDNYDEEDVILNNFEIIKNNPAGIITQINFNTLYSGDVKIVEMSQGYLIPK